jgi:hypothetical protein
MTKKQAIEYITGFDLYDTMNSWNNARGYSFNVKIHSLPFTSEEVDKLYQIISDEYLYQEFYFQLNEVIAEYENIINKYWNTPRVDPMGHINPNEDPYKQFEIGFNGKNGGHLVLYKWNGYNYTGTGWSFTEEELQEMSRDEVMRIYKVLTIFEECYQALIETSKDIASWEVSEETYTVKKTRKVFNI